MNAKRLCDRLNKAKGSRNRKLDIANKWLGGFGIEGFTCGDTECSYVNMGDTYSETICAIGGKLFVSTWGDVYEKAEQDHEEGTGTIRCGYCGEFTPVAENWRETVCESCGHKADGSN